MTRFKIWRNPPTSKAGWEDFQARLVSLLKRQKPKTTAGRVFLSIEWRHSLDAIHTPKPEKAWGVVRDAFRTAGVGRPDTEYAIGQCVFYKASQEKPAVLVTMGDEP